MKLFGTRSKKKEEQKILPWHFLESVEQLDKLLLQSNGKLVVIYKHSTRCGISKMVLRRFEAEYRNEWDDKLMLYGVNVLERRTVSQEIAARFQVWHESPQLILLKNEKVVYHNSHAQINAAILPQYL